MKTYTAVEFIAAATLEDGVYWLEADGENVGIEVPINAECKTYGLRGDLNGSIIVYGNGKGHAWRIGKGDGDAYKYGGYGNAQRTGSGDGDAQRHGDGNGDAGRSGKGEGEAWRTGSGGGNSLRTGEGVGDALRTGSGDGDAWRFDEGNGNAIRTGGGVGEALRTGSGNGDGDARRTGGDSTKDTFKKLIDIERRLKTLEQVKYPMSPTRPWEPLEMGVRDTACNKCGMIFEVSKTYGYCCRNLACPMMCGPVTS